MENVATIVCGPGKTRNIAERSGSVAEVSAGLQHGAAYCCDVLSRMLTLLPTLLLTEFAAARSSLLKACA